MRKLRKDCWITPTMYLEEAEDDDGDVEEVETKDSDNTDDLLRGLLLAGVLLEPHLELLDSLATEAGQPGVQHQLEGKSFSDLLKELPPSPAPCLTWTR